MSRPVLLVATSLEPPELDLFRDEFEIVYAPSAEAFATALAEKGGAVRAILARNAMPIGARELDSLLALELVVALGSGTDAIDSAALAARGVRLATGRGVNASAVADHAMALLLASLRNLVPLDRAVRAQGWGRRCEPPASVAHTRLGIVGLGAIGSEIARRADAFGMAVAYHGRNSRSDVPYAYHADLAQMADWCDALVLCCPGGPATRHLVDSEVIARVGPRGHLVNVARGSVVDTAALIEALEAGRIAGAALDVLESSQQQFERLAKLSNVLLTPHTAGRSPESLAAAIELGLTHLRRHFSGERNSEAGVTNQTL